MSDEMVESLTDVNAILSTLDNFTRLMFGRLLDHDVPSLSALL